MESGIESRSSPVSRLFLAKSLILARLWEHVNKSAPFVFPASRQAAYRFWNQICTDLSVMLISSAILSLTAAVGVGFLLNSISRVVNWSCVARCLFWFFCCWVRVLFRGGRLEVDA